MVRGGHQHGRPGEPALTFPRLAGATAAAAFLALAAVPLPPGPRAAANPDGPAAHPGEPAAYLDGPPPGHTGGFGEPTCAACHFDAPVDPPEGGLDVRLLPPADGEGGSSRIEVSLWAPGLSRGGFQLSARHADGSRAGSQAGELRAADGRVRVVAADSGGVRYAVQTASGSTGARGDTLRWVVVWRPPGDGARGGGAGPAAGTAGRKAATPDGSAHEVRIHVAANASNDDASAFGDRIYTACVRPAPGGEETDARPCGG